MPGRPIDLAALRRLRESTKPWQLALRQAPPNADPAGLFRLLVIVSPGANSIRFMAPVRGEVSSERLLAALEEAMMQPNGTQVPARPPAIVVDDERLARQIELPMEGCGVAVSVQRHLPAVDPVLRALGRQTNLFSVAGQTPAEEAAPFLLEGEHTIAVEERDDRPVLVIRAAEPSAVNEVLTVLDGIALARRRSEGREVEVLFGLRGDEAAVLSVVGVSDDLAPLGEELGESDEIAVVVIAPQADSSTGPVHVLPRRHL